MTRAAIIFAALLLSGCTTETDLGPRIGAFDERDPTLIYKVSVLNVALAVIFVETIIVPVVVVVDETVCPVAKKKVQP